MEGEFAKDRSIQKIHHRETQHSLHGIKSDVVMSAKKQDRFMKEQRREMEEVRKNISALVDLANKKGDIPKDVTAISGISTASMTMSRSTEDYDFSPRTRRSRTAFEPPSPSKLPALSSSEHSFNNDGAMSEQAEINILRQQNAELVKRLEEEIQKKESVTVEKRQTEKQLNIFTDPRKRKIEAVNPVQSKQSASERKAEMQYLERRKSGLMEQMHGRKLLESERVQTSRPTTRSRTRAAKPK